MPRNEVSRHERDAPRSRGIAVMLQRTFQLQQDAVGQCKRALQQASDKLQECYARQNDYDQRLVDAKDKPHDATRLYYGETDVYICLRTMLGVSSGFPKRSSTGSARFTMLRPTLIGKATAFMRRWRNGRFCLRRGRGACCCRVCDGHFEVFCMEIVDGVFRQEALREVLIALLDECRGAGAKDMTCFCGEARPAGARLSVRWGIRAVCQILVSGGSWTECVACWPLFVERGGAGRLRGDGKCDRMRKRVGRCTI